MPYTIVSEKLTIQQKVGQLFMVAVFINDSEEEVKKTEKLIHDHYIGALCFFHSRASAATNFEGKKKVVHNNKSHERLKELIVRYQNVAKIPLLIAIDAEWGLAMRIENTPQYPYAITLGALQNRNDLIYEVGKQIGQDCREAGIHWNLAPVVDINDNPINPVIGYRSFGDDKHDVAKKATAYLQGMKAASILNALKHFPGHGDTETDSHLGLPVIDKSASQIFNNELHPYFELLDDEVDAIMVGHLAVPALDPSRQPATTSVKIVTELLRDMMAFENVIISDALNMHAVSKEHSEKGTLEAASFNAGMDMLCFSENPIEGILKIMAPKNEKVVEKSFERVWKLKEKAFGSPVEDTIKRKFSASELNREIAKNCITTLFANKEELMDKRGGFLNLSCGNPLKNHFSELLETEFGQTHYRLDQNTIREVQQHAKKSQPIVLALFPPSAKPKNKFSFEPKLLEAIQMLIFQNKVTFYLFGNPYVLDAFEDMETSGVVLLYQDFPEFQEVAFDYFKGRLQAKGRLSVQLKTQTI